MQDPEKNKTSNMPAWSPKIEKLIRKLGDYTDSQMKDLLDPKASAGGTALRAVFRGAAIGIPLRRRLKKEGLQFDDWLPGLQKIVDLAEQNGSDAAEKIKKSIPVATQLNAEMKSIQGGMLKDIRYEKSKGIAY